MSNLVHVLHDSPGFKLRCNIVRQSRPFIFIFYTVTHCRWLVDQKQIYRLKFILDEYLFFFFFLIDFSLKLIVDVIHI